MKITQILPDNLNENIPLKKALCLRIEKKNTGEVMKFLKNYYIDYEKSAFYLERNSNFPNNNEKESYKVGKHNLKHKNLVYQNHENIKIENIDLSNCDFPIFEIRDISFLKRAKPNNSNKNENFIFLSFSDNIEYLREFKNKEFTNDIINFLSERFFDKSSLNLHDINYLSNENNCPILFFQDIPSIQPSTEKQIEFCKNYWSILIQPSIHSKIIYQHSNTEEEKIFNIYLELTNNKDKYDVKTILYNPYSDSIVATMDGDEADYPPNINHSVFNCINLFCSQLNEELILKEKKENVSKNFLLGKKENIPIISSEEQDDKILLKSKNEKDFEHLVNKNEQYYCQGLYLFTFSEPCFMCSMALVHSRIERVYFLKYNNKDGALSSLIKLNSYNLNHNFLVFKIDE